MTEYNFELHFVLPEDRPDSEDHLDALFEAGCDDALVGAGKLGHIALDFTREAKNAEEAILSSVENVMSAIPDARLISASPDLVNLSDMPKVMEKWEVAHLTRQAMRKYAFDQVKKVMRPFPAEALFNGTSLWHMNEVVSWLLDNGKVDRPDRAQELLDLTNSARKLNAALEYARNKAPAFDSFISKVAH
ncbi:DNA-binding protein [Zhongshania marina]|jgi:hypothetical protein|uniref:DNA-binding protein n=1 Tax=Zhongshania marina TaxID=2304603 RepID=A0A2S4HK03_9GAMM|nr:DNA-binding protein [Marortus luteolus]POP54279.1 DNA-binding protein [Marortus luteolus]